MRVTAEDYYVRLIDLPYCVKGMVTSNPDGTFNIYIKGVLKKET
jgi:hypothetical protein